MGREIRRVALDFAHPVGKPWPGFLMPEDLYLPKCPRCNGDGYSLVARRLKDMWYGQGNYYGSGYGGGFRPADRGSAPFLPTDTAVRAFAERNVTRSPEYYGRGEAAVQREAERLCAHWNSAWCYHLNEDDVAALIEGGRLYDLTHTWTPESKWQPKSPPHVPTPREVGEWAISGMGHDAINQWIVMKAECKRRNVAHECDRCSGSGEEATQEQREAHDAWTSTDPPAGDGWQLWETVSEGSPISPVFATAEQLAQHMAREGDPVWGKHMDSAAWLKWITDSGWAPSMIVDAGGVRSGMEA